MSKEAIKAVEEESNRYVAFIESRKKKSLMIDTPTHFLQAPLSDVPATEEVVVPLRSDYAPS